MIYVSLHIFFQHFFLSPYLSVSLSFSHPPPPSPPVAISSVSAWETSLARSSTLAAADASRSTRMRAPVDENRAESTSGGGPVRSRTFSHDSIVGTGIGAADGGGDGSG